MAFILCLDCVNKTALYIDMLIFSKLCFMVYEIFDKSYSQLFLTDLHYDLGVTYWPRQWRRGFQGVVCGGDLCSIHI